MAQRKFRIVRKDLASGDVIEEIGWADREDLAQERVHLEDETSGSFFEIERWERTAVIDQIFESS